MYQAIEDLHRKRHPHAYGSLIRTGTEGSFVKNGPLKIAAFSGDKKWTVKFDRYEDEESKPMVLHLIRCFFGCYVVKLTWKVKKCLQLSTLFRVSSEQILQKILSHSFLHHFTDSHLQYAFQYPKTNNTIWVFTFVPEFMSKCTFFRLSNSLHLFCFFLFDSFYFCLFNKAGRVGSCPRVA